MKRFFTNLWGALGNAGRLAAATTISQAWSLLRFTSSLLEDPDTPIHVLWRMSRMYGRRESPWPLVCRDCGYCAMERRMIHGYEDDGGGDVCPVDTCRNCGSDNLDTIGAH